MKDSASFFICSIMIGLLRADSEDLPLAIFPLDPWINAFWHGLLPIFAILVCLLLLSCVGIIGNYDKK